MATTKIYLIRGGDLVKIGKADDPFARLQNLQSGSPIPLALLGWIEADASEERRLHRLFHDQRERGEWFRWCPELQAFAATLTQPVMREKAGPKVKEVVLEAGQCRAARRGMNLTAAQLAAAARVTRHTVNRFEAGLTSPSAGRVWLIRMALEKAGAEFPDLETVRLPRRVPA